MKPKFYFFFVFLISVIYLCLRLDGIRSKLTYYLDQGIHLAESKEMLDTGKIRLIGPMVISKTADNRGFFIGPFYYYYLAVVGLVSNWNPLTITIVTLLIEFLSFLFFVLWIWKKFGYLASLSIFLFFAFANHFIVHSHFFWNPHFLIPISILLVFCLDKYNQQKKSIYLLLAEILCGFGFSFHYSAILWIFPILFVILKNKKVLKNILLLPLFFIVGDLPFFVFEIRHNFYNLTTAIGVFSQSTQSHKIGFYYFSFSLITIFLYLWAKYFSLVKWKTKILFILLLLILDLTIFYFNDKTTTPLGLPAGWDYPTTLTAVSLIKKSTDCRNFNIAATVGGDTRAYDLRFLLAKDGCPPLGVADYPNAHELFLVAPNNRPPETETVWEVSSFAPFLIKNTYSLNNYVKLYQLVKK